MRWKEGDGARDGRSEGDKLAAGDSGGGGAGGGGGISRRISIGCAREAKWVEVDRSGRRRMSRREEKEEEEEEKERNFASSSGLAFW